MHRDAHAVSPCGPMVNRGLNAGATLVQPLLGTMGPVDDPGGRDAIGAGRRGARGHASRPSDYRLLEAAVADLRCPGCSDAPAAIVVHGGAGLHLRCPECGQRIEPLRDGPAVARLVVADTDPLTGATLALLLRAAQITVDPVPTSARALARCEQDVLALVTEATLPGSSAAVLAARVRRVRGDLFPVVVFTRSSKPIHVAGDIPVVRKRDGFAALLLTLSRALPGMGLEAAVHGHSPEPRWLAS